MASSRRLLTVGHSYVLRVNRQLAHAIQAGSGGRWDVTVAAPKVFVGQRDIRPAKLDLTGPEQCRVVPLNAYLTSRVHAFAYGRELRAVVRWGWDLVHVWEEPYILAGYQIARWTPGRVPFVFRTAQSLNKSYLPPFRQMERWVVDRAAGWVCSGQTVAGNLRARPGYAAKPMALIPLGVNLGAFRPDRPSGATVLRQLGWDPVGPPVVGYLGRFVPEKGLGLLSRVLDRLDIPWRALLLGGGPDEQSVRSWGAKYPDRVRVLGVRHDDVPRYLNAMDVLVAPSQTTLHWREQFGRMLVEAFASGVPVIGSDSGEIPNVIADAGVVVGETNEVGWQRALTELLSDPDRRAEYAARGLERVRQFTWTEVGRRHVEFFDRILESARGDRS